MRGDVEAVMACGCRIVVPHAESGTAELKCDTHDCVAVARVTAPPPRFRGAATGPLVEGS